MIRTNLPQPVPRASVSRVGAKPNALLAPLTSVTEKVIAQLKQVVSRGVDEGIDREELMDHIGEVLAGYGQLRQTPFQTAIDNFLIRTCSTNFSLELTEEELSVLWR